MRTFFRQTFGAEFDRLIACLDPPSLSQWSSIRTLVKDCSTALDLGCGEGNHLPVGLPEALQITGVDSHRASLDVAMKHERYTDVICGDIFSVLADCRDASYDAVIACDLIEHLTTASGAILAAEMRRVSRRIAIIATPNGFVPQPPRADNPANEHLSGWNPRDLNALGFSVISGHYGWRRLRTTYGLPKLKPGMAGDLVACITARPIARFPHHAYQLVAVAPPQSHT